MPDPGKDTAVTFVTDNGFLIPSIVAALQALAQPAVTATADVFVFTVGVNPETVAEVTRLFTSQGIKFAAMPAESFVPTTDVYFRKSHIPLTALGRFAIDSFLPAQYQNIVYFDGDVQIAGDISPLVHYRVPSGYIAAAPEFIWLTEGDIGAFWAKHKDYLNKLGIINPKEYFNSGVLAADRETWARKSKEALHYFETHSELCMYHDQSALNAVCRGAVKSLSPIYNYSTVYASLGIHDEMKPKVIHFTGGGKPWNYKGPPWNGRFYDVYANFVKDHSSLSKFLDVSIRVPSVSGSPLAKVRELLLRHLRLGRRQRAMRTLVTTEPFVTT